MTINITFSNVVKSVPDDRDYLYVPRNEILPSAIDLKPGVYEIDDQKSTGSCTANAATSACEFILKQAGKPISLSRLFTYYDTRNNVEDRAGQEGASGRDAVRSLYHTGTCPEYYWPYDESKVDTKPSQEAYNAIGNYKVGRYESIPTCGGLLTTYPDPTIVLHAIKSAISEGIPVILSMCVGKQIYSLKGDWKTHHMDSVYSGKNTIVGGHAVLIIGYDDSCQKFLVENSWGSGWGDGGFFGISYDTLVTDVMELFIVREFAGYSLCNTQREAESITPMVATTSIQSLDMQIVGRMGDVITESSPITTTITGGKPPYKVDWHTSYGSVEQLEGNNFNVQTHRIWHTWDNQPPVNGFDVLQHANASYNITCTVYDSTYPDNQQKQVITVPTAWARGLAEPTPPVEPIVPPQPEPTNNNDEDDRLPVGAIVGVVLALVALIYFNLF